MFTYINVIVVGINKTNQQQQQWQQCTSIENYTREHWAHIHTQIEAPSTSNDALTDLCAHKYYMKWHIARIEVLWKVMGKHVEDIDERQAISHLQFSVVVFFFFITTSFVLSAFHIFAMHIIFNVLVFMLVFCVWHRAKYAFNSLIHTMATGRAQKAHSVESSTKYEDVETGPDRWCSSTTSKNQQP